MQLSVSDILRAVCPKCRQGKVTHGLFRINRRCPTCGHDFYPESGYYLGAIMIAYFVTALLTIPTMVILKLMGARMSVLLSFPVIQYIVLAPVLMHFARVAWLHVDFSTSDRLDGPKK